MDAAARRVRAADLARLSALRERREGEALREARRRAAARDAARAEELRAERRVEVREVGRREGERALYEGLNAGEAIGLGALELHRARLEHLSDAVEEARSEQVRRAGEAEEARSVYEDARAIHGARSRETRKWEAARSRILTARRAAADLAEEAELEDETLMRLGAGGRRS